MVSRRERVGLALAIAAALIGCDGTITLPHLGSTTPTTPTPEQPKIPFPCDGAIEPGPTTMRLLSTEQYLNTVRDLVGPVAQLDTVFASSQGPSAFGLVQADVAQVELETFQHAAELIAAATVANATQLNALAPCAATADKRGCARDFVQRFAAKAYRAPVTDAADIDAHLKVYDVGAATSYARGIELVMRAVLQAPRFLYRVELGTGEQVGPDAVKLSGYEIAARLSYAAWNTMPDDRLTLAAAHGDLATREGVAAQLTWMLQDPRGQTMVRRFLESWIQLGTLDGLVKDAALYPKWQQPTFRASVRGQASAFFDDVLARQGGRLSALLTSDTVFVNSDLGSYYGVTGGAAFTPLQLTDGSASGMLTLPALLATLAKPAETSPIYRGKFIREQLLCQQLPAPPANVPKPPEVTPGVSARERFKQHETDPACSGCHVLMDPIGFGFESFDPVGRFRATDNGQPIDVSGEVVSSDDANGKFVGVAELGTRLAASAQVRECVARQWFRFGLSRFEQPVDNCSMQHLLDQFVAQGADLNTLPLLLVQTDAFLYRRPLDSTVTP